MINNLVTCGKHSNHSSVSKSQNFVQEKKKEPFQNVVQWSQVWNVNFGESRGRAANFSFLPLSHSPSRQGNVFIPACFLLSVSCIVLVCTRDKKHVLVQRWHVWPPTIWSLIKLHRQVFMCKVGHCSVAWSIWPDLCPFCNRLSARIYNGDVKKKFYSSSVLFLDEKWKSFPNKEQNVLIKIITTLILGVMVFFLWPPNVWFLAVKHVFFAPIRACFFVTRQHSDATDSNHRHLFETLVASLLEMYFSIVSS